jgi:TPR repeat protein
VGAIVATAWIAFAAPAPCGPREDAANSYQRGDYAAAFNDFKALADKGDAHAQYMLGLMYHDGQGISPNETAAFGWFLKAAQQGNADAENYVGYMYYNGQGVAEDKSFGFNWLHKAALQGNATAEFRLGIAYVDGKGTAQDDARAVTWFRKAAEQGNSDAQFWLAHSGSCTTRAMALRRILSRQNTGSVYPPPAIATSGPTLQRCASRWHLK